jgi:Ni/Fe-hydrogenase b-type cytochrome subunit
MSEPTDPPPPAVRRHHGVVRLSHWLNAVFLTGMIGSGLQIYAAFPHIGSKGAVLGVPNPFDSDKIGGLSETIRLGGWLAGGLRWHFTLAWPFVLTGLAYLIFLAVSGEWRKLLFRPRDVPGAVQMTRYYLRLRKDHPPQGKHNPLQKAAYTTAILLAVLSVLTGFAIAKPIQLGWVTGLFGGYELARYWHFVVVWAFTLFTIMHVIMVLVADRASLRAIITGRYRGRFPNDP